MHESFGKNLIAMRKACGLSQGDFAQMVGVPTAQVARDERNEYHGLSLRHAQRLLQALKDYDETIVSQAQRL